MSNLTFDMPADRRAQVEPRSSLEERAALAQGSITKRTIDIVLAGGGLVVLSLFLVLVALLIRAESRAPILFRQRRTGYGGVPFVIYKFRTMHVVEDGDVIEHATRRDCRTTRIGRLLRRTSLDELPQLINVLKGEMSLVGPRPHALAHDRYYETVVDNYADRFLVKPGITGLAQISGCRGEITSTRCMAQRVDYDLSYIHRWSVWLDVWILLKTLVIGVFDPAAY